MNTGDLNRRILFQRKVAAPGFASAGKEAWEAATSLLWAQVQDVLPSRSEKLAEGMSIASRPARIRIRYREGITPDMRILYGARTMQITAGPAELGNRDWLELMAEDYSTAGGVA